MALCRVVSVLACMLGGCYGGGTKPAGWRVFWSLLVSGRGISRGCGRGPARAEGGSCIAVADICSAVSEISSAVFQICSAVSGKLQRSFEKLQRGFWKIAAQFLNIAAQFL